MSPGLRDYLRLLRVSARASSSSRTFVTPVGQPSGATPGSRSSGHTSIETYRYNNPLSAVAGATCAESLRGVSMKPRLLTRKQAADACNMSVEFIRDRMADGSLPFFKMGRAVRISSDDLDAYLQSSRSDTSGGAS